MENEMNTFDLEPVDIELDGKVFSIKVIDLIDRDLTCDITCKESISEEEMDDYIEKIKEFILEAIKLGIEKTERGEFDIGKDND